MRIIVPFPPGGPTDYIARLLAQKLTEAWSQTVVVDNRAGAGGNIGAVLRTAYGVPLQHIPYKGAGPALNDVLGGQLQIGSTALPPPVPHVRAGTLKALGVTSSKRSSALPDAPTIAESGFPGYVVDNMVGVLVSAATPRALVAKLNADIARILNQPDVRERLSGVGFDAIGNPSAEFGVYLKSEMAKWAKVIKDSGAKVD